MDEASAFRIDFNGQWYHGGRPITRQALVQLFATRALKREADGTYWLKTPHEAYPVEVEDVPFLVVGYDIQGSQIDFLTNLDERVTLGPEKTIILKANIPYIEVRSGLEARVNRSVYYDLVARAEREGQNLILRSLGVAHILGRLEE